MSLPPVESDLLRQMVREVLQELVPRAMAAAPAPATSGATVEAVSIASDDDLQAFARRVASAGEQERAAILSGAVSFRLTGREHAHREHAGGDHAGAGGGAPAEDVVRIDSGAVTERHVRDAAAAGRSIHLGRKAVLTPLARDRARAAGVEITRER